MAIATLPARSCLIDGEAIVCDENGLAIFELIRRQRTGATAVHCAFDLLELDGEDLRRQPIELRKRRLGELLECAPSSLALNAHYEGDGAIVFKHACKLGCEGIVSKRLGSHYRSGRTPHWVKVKNPKAPAVTREAERIGREFPRFCCARPLPSLRPQKHFEPSGAGRIWPQARRPNSGFRQAPAMQRMRERQRDGKPNCAK